MKFTQLLVSVFFMFTLPVCFAQDFEATLIAGGAFSQVDGDAFGGYNKVGAQTGIGIQRKINEKWKGGFELLFTQKGSRKRLDPDDPIRDIFILKFNYIEMPLLAYYNAGPFDLFGGPSIGYLVNAKGDTGLGFKEIDDINKTEVALKLGVNYKINDQWRIGVSHGSSLLRVGNPYLGGVYLFTRNGLYNRLFMATLAYQLKNEK